MVHLQKETQFPPAGIDSARLNAVSPIVCWAFYLYVFSIPFEIPNRSIPLEVPTVVGCLFLLVTLLRSRECFCWPPAAFWCFLVYLCMYVIVSLWHGEEAHQEEVIKLFFSLFQLMFLFWTAYTLTRHEKVSRAVLLTLVVSCAVRSVLQLSALRPPALKLPVVMNGFRLLAKMQTTLPGFCRWDWWHSLVLPMAWKEAC